MMSRMKIGLEIEAFVRGNYKGSDDQLVLCPASIPRDGYPLLAEARGLPHSSVHQAVFSAFAELYDIEDKLKELGLTLAMESDNKVSHELAREVSKQLRKEPAKWNNIYGYVRHKLPRSHATAGIHVSVTHERRINYGPQDKREHVEYFEMWDYPMFIIEMDKYFWEDIRLSRRVPGSYEIKPDGRFEYRSLPNTVTKERLILGINEVLKRCK
jgi:hypothetical protein